MLNVIKFEASMVKLLFLFFLLVNFSTGTEFGLKKIKYDNYCFVLEGFDKDHNKAFRGPKKNLKKVLPHYCKVFKDKQTFIETAKTTINLDINGEKFLHLIYLGHGNALAEKKAYIGWQGDCSHGEDVVGNELAGLSQEATEKGWTTGLIVHSCKSGNLLFNRKQFIKPKIVKKETNLPCVFTSSRMGRYAWGREDFSFLYGLESSPIGMSYNEILKDTLREEKNQKSCETSAYHSASMSSFPFNEWGLSSFFEKIFSGCLENSALCEFIEKIDLRKYRSDVLSCEDVKLIDEMKEKNFMRKSFAKKYNDHLSFYRETDSYENIYEPALRNEFDFSAGFLLQIDLVPGKQDYIKNCLIPMKRKVSYKDRLSEPFFCKDKHIISELCEKSVGFRFFINAKTPDQEVGELPRSCLLSFEQNRLFDIGDQMGFLAPGTKYQQVEQFYKRTHMIDQDIAGFCEDIGMNYFRPYCEVKNKVPEITMIDKIFSSALTLDLSKIEDKEDRLWYQACERIQFNESRNKIIEENCEVDVDCQD